MCRLSLHIDADSKFYVWVENDIVSAPEKCFIYPEGAMQPVARIAISVLGVLGLSLSACAAQVDDLEEGDDAGSVSQPAFTRNAFTRNALSASALTADDQVIATLMDTPLTSEAIASEPALMSALRDPLAREFLSYAVSCALPASESVSVSVDGKQYDLRGQLGLASRWGARNGHCNADCRGWVSACMLARVNHLGESVPLSMRAKDKALSSDTAERSTYLRREGAYYGDVFARPQLRFACTSPGSTLIGRVCGGTGDDTEGCVVDVLGDCDNVCKHVAKDGSFQSCKGNGRTIPAAVTIFRQ